MNRCFSESTPRTTRRRWRIPPPLVQGSDLLAAASVRQETAGALGQVLFHAIEDVIAWASAHPARREGLFAPTMERERVAGMMLTNVPPELEDPLGALTVMVGRPGRARAERVVLACRQIASWADVQGKLATAFDFSLAATLVCPGDASAAFTVGRLARRRADYVTAETWLRRAVLLARQNCDSTSYASGFIGLGTMYMQRGNFPTARKFYARAVRAARAHGLRDLEGGALHDLLAIAIQTGECEDARRYAQGAFEAYGKGHRQLPALGHDVAYFWLTQGCFEQALPVFQAVLPHIDGISDQLLVHASIARAAGGLGDRETFDDAWLRTLALIDVSDAGEHSAEALLNLARGAASLRDWERAEEVAQRAYTVSRIRREALMQFEAESVIDSLRRDSVAEIRVELEALAETTWQDENLADDFVQVLNTLAVPA